MKQIEWFNKEILKHMRKQMESISDSTWHKIMNPYCGQCMLERGRKFIERKGGQK